MKVVLSQRRGKSQEKRPSASMSGVQSVGKNMKTLTFMKISFPPT